MKEKVVDFSFISFWIPTEVWKADYGNNKEEFDFNENSCSQIFKLKRNNANLIYDLIEIFLIRILYWIMDKDRSYMFSTTIKLIS